MTLEHKSCILSRSDGIQMKLFRGDSYEIRFLSSHISQHQHIHTHDKSKTLNLIRACLLWKAPCRKIDLIRLMRLCKHEMLSDAVICTPHPFLHIQQLKSAYTPRKSAHTHTLTHSHFRWNLSEREKLFVFIYSRNEPYETHIRSD